MTPEDILAEPPRVLSQAQREAYFMNGYVMAERLVPDRWLERLKAVTAEFVEECRGVTQSDQKWDLEEGHTAQSPRPRRLSMPVEHHPTYWEYASDSIITDLAADLLGPNIKFHHSKLNFKWSGGGSEVKWHQDIQFYPHTNYNVLAIGTYLEDVDEAVGPMGVVPGSHEGELFNLYDGDDTWVGAIDPNDLPRVPLKKAVYLEGPAGSVTVHHSRAVHGSRPNTHPTRPRPLLINAYSSADALPITPYPIPGTRDGTIVRGKAARWAEFDPRPCLLPPDWSGGYTSIFALQQKEDAAATE
jgi:ectoine hydroxylase-related dioxygenase (phytanoyl-CoA dioxygenase family)